MPGAGVAGDVGEELAHQRQNQPAALRVAIGARRDVDFDLEAAALSVLPGDGGDGRGKPELQDYRMQLKNRGSQLADCLVSALARPNDELRTLGAGCRLGDVLAGRKQ